VHLTYSLGSGRCVNKGTGGFDNDNGGRGGSSGEGGYGDDRRGGGEAPIPIGPDGTRRKTLDPQRLAEAVL